MSTNFSHLNASPAELGRLLSRPSSTLLGWAKSKGLPRNSNGTYNVKAALLWYAEHQRRTRLPIRLEAIKQEELVTILGQSRQWIIARNRDGLPRRADGLYDLRAVCRWLPGYYERRAKMKYGRNVETLRKKLRRNVRQCERFFDGETRKLDK